MERKSSIEIVNISERNIPGGRRIGISANNRRQNDGLIRDHVYTCCLSRGNEVLVQPRMYIPRVNHSLTLTPEPVLVQSHPPRALATKRSRSVHALMLATTLVILAFVHIWISMSTCDSQNLANFSETNEFLVFL